MARRRGPTNAATQPTLSTTETIVAQAVTATYHTLSKFRSTFLAIRQFLYACSSSGLCDDRFGRAQGRLCCCVSRPATACHCHPGIFLGVGSLRIDSHLLSGSPFKFVVHHWFFNWVCFPLFVAPPPNIVVFEDAVYVPTVFLLGCYELFVLPEKTRGRTSLLCGRCDFFVHPVDV